MLILQPVQPAAPVHVPPRLPAAAETPVAVESAGASDHARNDGTRDRGSEAAGLARAAQDRAPDPARAVGPPPAFQANVLETERARLRAGAPIAAETAPPDADTAPPPAPAPGDYAAAAALAPPPRVDLTR